MTIDSIKSIFRRWHKGHSLLSIREAEGFDRNTIRNYIRMFEAAGYKPGCIVPEEKKLIHQFQEMLPLNARQRTVRTIFEKYKEEIKSLITRKEEPVKAKTAYLILKGKYNIAASYETFKLFIREQAMDVKSIKAPLRIELPPGKEIQVDYGKVGLFFDPVEKRNRTVWAFCARLSFSRLPFIEFVFTQNQESFVESHVRMAEFYGGITKFLTIDNLKSGVIKPDLYDPKLNRAYAEFAEHYDTFINPCRVARAEDKGKIERLVPQARELYRRLKEIHPTFTLNELTAAARDWCLSEYGQTKHGTTGCEPASLFLEEKQSLTSLNPLRFEVPVWKSVLVHRDRFFTFDGKFYVMPYAYRGCKLNVKKKTNLLYVFDQNHTLLRQYPITGKRFSWLDGDFPEDSEAMMRGEYPQWILNQARQFGSAAEKLIESILHSHAYINARRARGMLSVLEKYKAHPFRDAVCGEAHARRIYVPKQLSLLFESEMYQNRFAFIIPRSKACEAMIRDVKEYFN